MEFYGLFTSVRMLSEEESKERLDDIDDNEDGKVSWKEYIEETFGIDSDDNDVIQLEDLEEQRVGEILNLL